MHLDLNNTQSLEDEETNNSKRGDIDDNNDKDETERNVSLTSLFNDVFGYSSRLTKPSQYCLLFNMSMFIYLLSSYK